MAFLFSPPGPTGANSPLGVDGSPEVVQLRKMHLRCLHGRMPAWGTQYPGGHNMR